MKPVTLEGLPSRAIHTHGGEGAQLETARFRVVNPGPARTLTALRVEVLESNRCEPPTEVTRKGPVTLSLGGEAARSSEVQIPARTTVDLVAHFPAVDAYMAYCERWAFRLVLRDGVHTVQAVAETKVEREEPLREDEDQD
jgi:hypothetical protein